MCFVFLPSFCLIKIGLFKKKRSSTENLKAKLESVNLSTDNLSVELDKSYAFPQTKLVDYKGIKNKTTKADQLP